MEFKPSHESKITLTKNLNDLISRKIARGRPNSSIEYKGSRGINKQANLNTRIRKSSNINDHTVLSKKREINCFSSEIFSTFDCNKVIQSKKKSTSKTYSQSISGIPNTLQNVEIPTKIISGFPLKPRNFSMLNKTLNLSMINKLNSTENESNQILVKQSIGKYSKDDNSRYKFLVYKGNNSLIIKKLLELRSN